MRRLRSPTTSWPDRDRTRPTSVYPAEADTGNGIQVCDQGHNLPEEGEHYTPPVDFVTAYHTLWGIG